MESPTNSKMKKTCMKVNKCMQQTSTVPDIIKEILRNNDQDVRKFRKEAKRSGKIILLCKWTNEIRLEYKLFDTSPFRFWEETKRLPLETVPESRKHVWQTWKMYCFLEQT